MLKVYQEPMILQWDKVVTIISLTINSQDKSDENYKLGLQDEEEGYGTASAQQDEVGGAQRRGRAPRTSTKWPSDTMIVTEVDIVGMPVPLTQKRKFRALAGRVARQKILLHLPEIKELSNDEKWDLFDKNVQKHLKLQEDANRRHSSFFGRRQPRHGDNSDFSLAEILSEKELSHLQCTCLLSRNNGRSS
jgi:hypothetical protein